MKVNTPVKSMMIVVSKHPVIFTSKVRHSFVHRSIHCWFSTLEPQWRFESKLPQALEGDENDKIELECSVQDEDAECDWYYAGEVSRSMVSWIRQLFSSHRKSYRNPIQINTKSFLMAK